MSAGTTWAASISALTRSSAAGAHMSRSGGRSRGECKPFSRRTGIGPAASPLTDDLPWEAGDATDPENATLAALVPTGPGDPIDSGSLMFFTAITAARDRIWIASPYFIPDTDIMSALVSAALAGRDVRILLPLPRSTIICRGSLRTPISTNCVQQACGSSAIATAFCTRRSFSWMTIWQRSGREPRQPFLQAISRAWSSSQTETDTQIDAFTSIQLWPLRLKQSRDPLGQHLLKQRRCYAVPM